MKASTPQKVVFVGLELISFTLVNQILMHIQYDDVLGVSIYYTAKPFASSLSRNGHSDVMES